MANPPSGKPSDKKKKRGGKIDVHAYIPPQLYDELYSFRDPDKEDRWESELLRKIIREWLSIQRSGHGGALAGENEPRSPKKSGGGILHKPVEGKKNELDRPSVGGSGA